MIQVYLDRSSPRIEYVLDFIFAQRNLAYEVILDKDFFESSSHPFKFAYCKNYDGQSPWIACSTFMLESEVSDVEVKKYVADGVELLSFRGESDVLASIFYVITRYEEYTSTNRDEYDRFRFEDSILCENWVNLAVCDRWAEHVIEKISNSISFETGVANLIPSFDIDNSFAYRLKEGKRTWVSVAKDLITLNFERLRERLSVMSGKLKDPYDTFDSIRDIACSFPNTKIFWLIGKWGKKDRNISIQHEGHQSLIKEMSHKVDIGLHPSYGSFLKSSVIAQEKKELERVVSDTIEDSRQHYLRFRLPETFQQLLENNFTDEWSMGFAAPAGFRCGTARAFNWFDLSKNDVTELVIHPFVYMDGTLREYMKLDISQSKQIISKLYHEVNRYGGDFVFIWHNETIGDYRNWKGWSEVLRFTLNLKDEKQ